MPSTLLQAMAADPEHFNKLIASVAPRVIDMDHVKKGLLCQLFGGVSKSTAAALGGDSTSRWGHNCYYFACDTYIAPAEAGGHVRTPCSVSIIDCVMWQLFTGLATRLRSAKGLRRCSP